MSELLPCPFCGQRPSHVERWTLTSYAVVCYCDARGPLDEDGDYVGEPEEAKRAAELWNTRIAALSSREDVLEECWKAVRDCDGEDDDTIEAAMNAIRSLSQSSGDTP